MNVPILCITAAALVIGRMGAYADEMDDAYQNLKTAVSKADAAQVEKLVPAAAALARKAEAEPAPSDADLKVAWTQHVAYAKEIETYCEYALYATALRSSPQSAVTLFAALEAQNPKSKYLNDAYGPYFVVLKATGATAKIPGIAEKAVENLPENEELLAVLAETALSRKQDDRALAFANRLTAACAKHSNPANVPAADWERTHNAWLGRGYWISGVVNGEKGQFMKSEKELREALPLIKGNQAMMGPALFYLGVDNYRLGKMTLSKAKVLDGARFSQEAADIPGPYQDQAWRNAQIMKDEAGKMR